MKPKGMRARRRGNRREPVRGFRLELERLTARATGFGGISGVSATGIGKAGGVNGNCFFLRKEKKITSEIGIDRTRVQSREPNHEREKPTFSTLRLTPSATEAVGVSFARPTEIGAGNGLVMRLVGRGVGRCRPSRD